MNLDRKIISSIYGRMRTKSLHSRANYRIVAVAFSRKGDVVGFASNNIRCGLSPKRRGAGTHAEMQLVRKYGRRVACIVIARFGKSGRTLPIDPCPNCAKVARQLGIKIMKLEEFRG